jgi:hypothetical protein
MKQSQSPSDLLIKTFYSGYNQPLVDPVKQGKVTIKSLELDSSKLHRQLELIQSKLNKIDKNRITPTIRVTVDALLAEELEVSKQIGITQKSILMLKKTINVHETTKGTQTLVSNIKDLNTATREIVTQTNIGSVDNVMNDLSELMDDNTVFQEALTTNTLVGNEPTSDDLFNAFMNKDCIEEELINPIQNKVTETTKRPLLVNSNKKIYTDSYGEEDYKELDNLVVPKTKPKFSIYGKTSDIEKMYGFT